MIAGNGADKGNVMARQKEKGRILFYGPRSGRYGCFSNFYPAVMTVDGKEYATVEHYFQACKAATEVEHDIIRTAASPSAAKKLGRKVVHLQPRWEKIKLDIMRRALREKFRQNPELRDILFSTGDRPLHEDSKHDREWGWVKGKGRDLLGKLLMRVRTTLRQELDEWNSN